MRILITNDDGIHSGGLHALKTALDAVGTVVVVAPDRNRSAIGRGITIGRAIGVEPVTLPDGSPAFACDGTPADCVRLAALGVAGDPPDLLVSGINLGPNLGDDVAYSGTVAAAFEGRALGWPAIAVSQASPEVLKEPWDATQYDFTAVARFVAGLAPSMALNPLPRGVILNVNGPGVAPDEVKGARIATLGRRIYNDRLSVESEDGATRMYRIYGDFHGHHDDPGTDLVAVHEGYISVTPMHFDLTEFGAMDIVASLPLDGLHLDDPTATVAS